MDDGSLLGGQWGHTHDINHHHFLGGSDIPWMSDDLEDVISRTCWSEHHFSMSSSRSKSGGRVLTFFLVGSVLLDAFAHEALLVAD